jgi:tRNA 2-thiouridine synthesizing protein A
MLPNSGVEIDHDLDARELPCPRPLLKTKQSLEAMQPGQILKVRCTDATTKSTFPSFLNRSGDELLGVESQGEEIHFFIKKK